MNKLIYTIPLLLILAVFLPINPHSVTTSHAVSALFSQQTMIAHADSFGLDNAVPNALKGKSDLITQIGYLVQLFLWGASAFFMIMVIWGGNIWMNAAGNEQKVAQAKKILATAVIGLFIMVAGYIITYFLVGALAHSTTTVPGSTTSGACDQTSGSCCPEPDTTCPTGWDATNCRCNP